MLEKEKGGATNRQKRTSYLQGAYDSLRPGGLYLATHERFEEIGAKKKEEEKRGARAKSERG